MMTQRPKPWSCVPARRHEHVPEEPGHHLPAGPDQLPPPHQQARVHKGPGAEAGRHLLCAFPTPTSVRPSCTCYLNQCRCQLSVCSCWLPRGQVWTAHVLWTLMPARAQTYWRCPCASVVPQPVFLSLSRRHAASIVDISGCHSHKLLAWPDRYASWPAVPGGLSLGWLDPGPALTDAC